MTNAPAIAPAAQDEVKSSPPRAVEVADVGNLLVLVALAWAVAPFVNWPTSLALSAWLVLTATGRWLCRWELAASAAVATAAVVALPLLVALVGPLLPNALNVSRLIQASYLGVILISSASVVRAVRTGRSGWRMRPTSVFPALAAGVGAGVWTTGLITSNALAGGYPSWAMGGDSRNNIVILRLLLDANGFTPSLSRQGLFLPNVVEAGFQTDPYHADAFRQIIPQAMGHASAWYFFIVLLTISAGLLSLRTTRGSHSLVRLGGAAISSCVPLLWIVLGASLELGYYSAMPTLALLVGSWTIYSDSSLSERSAILVLSTTTSLVALMWTPIALLAIPLLGLRFIRMCVSRQSSRHQVLVTAVFAAVPALLAAALTVPLALASSAWLAADGAIYGFKPWMLPATAGLSLWILAVNSKDSRQDVFGLGAMLAGAVLVIAYLLRQRAGLPVLWGYYPMKATWLTTCLFLVLLPTIWRGFGVTPQTALPRRIRPIADAVLSTSIVAVALVSYAQMLQPQPVETPLKAISHGWFGPSDSVVDPLFRAASQNMANVFFFEYSPPPNYRLGNFWSALSATDTQAAIVWAYVVDPGSIEALCQLEGEQGPLTVITSASDLDARVDTVCPDAQIQYQVEPSEPQSR